MCTKHQQIDQTYLPFSAEELEQHFTGNVENQIKYYQDSANRYHSFKKKHSAKRIHGVPLSDAKLPCQIEKDERFWTVTSIKTIFDQGSDCIKRLLDAVFQNTTLENNMPSWEHFLDGKLKLYFEACLPAPKSYRNWLKNNITHRQMIPYIKYAADKDHPRMEGATHVDALLINRSKGFAWVIESKVLSDISYMISYDNYRNQIARTLDVMIENCSQNLLNGVKLEKMFFSLLTPKKFKEMPYSRLYGWLFNEYKNSPRAISRDLPHRDGYDWSSLAARMSWITFDDIHRILPKACPWMNL